MSRFFLSAAALFSLLVAALVIPVRTDARSRRCEEEPPETLLSLYRNSTEIHIGTYDRVEDVGMIEDTEDYSVVDMRKHYSISSTLKGETRKFYAASEQDYRYKTVETDETTTSAESEEAVEPEEGVDSEVEAGSEEEDSYLADIPKPGDRVMIFLRKDDETGSIVLTHYRDAVKKMDAEEMAAYETRVNELNAIFAGKKVDETEVVAWLVKTAIDPLTRWEGAFELLSGFQNSEWRDERVKYLKEKEERGETIEDWERLDAEGEAEHATSARIAYVKLLTDSQKQELLTAVVGRARSENDGDERPVKLSDGDRILLELVSRWGDDRLVGHLLEQLRNNADLPYYNGQMMQMAAKALKDASLDDLAAKYANLYGGDEEVVSDEDLAAVDAVIKPAPAVKGTDTEESIENPETESGSDVVEPKTPTMTYAELRSMLLEKFISLGENILTTKAK